MLERSDLGLWAVADGMGGHRNGDRAATRLLAALEAPSEPSARASGYARLAELDRRAMLVNAELYSERATGGASGTTLVALLAHEGHVACVWAGDSRAYLLRGGELTLVSRDHSVVQDLVEAGALDERHRGAHPHAHVITRAVGASAQLELERRFTPARTGDVFLLCSDGLTTCLSKFQIFDLLDPEDLAGSADRLIEAALAAGAPDNVSVVLVRCG